MCSIAARIGTEGEKWKLAPRRFSRRPTIINKVKRRAAGVIGSELKRGYDEVERQSKGSLCGKQQPLDNHDEALDGVVRDRLDLWSGGVNAAGIPTANIFSHIAWSGART